MKPRRLVICVLILLGVGIAAALALYFDFPAKASATSLQDAMSALPSDCQFVFGINVQKFVASPFYARFQQKKSGQIGSDLAEFIEKTGVDPARDISYLVGGGRAGTKGEGVAIAIGKFDRGKIVAYIHSKTTPVETTYESASIYMIPEKKADTAEKGIAILNEQQIALGDMHSLKAVVDVRQKGNQSIVSNPTMGPLINDIGSDEMFWFAGDVAEAYAKTPVATPLGPNLLLVQQVVGKMNFGNSVEGKITAIAKDADSATKLADVVRGFIALGQLSGAKNPDLKTLLNSLTVSLNSTQVSIAMNFPADLLDKQMFGRKPQVASPKPQAEPAR